MPIVQCTVDANVYIFAKYIQITVHLSWTIWYLHNFKWNDTHTHTNNFDNLNGSIFCAQVSGHFSAITRFTIFSKCMHGIFSLCFDLVFFCCLKRNCKLFAVSMSLNEWILFPYFIGMHTFASGWCLFRFSAAKDESTRRKKKRTNKSSQHSTK